MKAFQPREKYTFDDLIEILKILRSPAGCPWDREQTHESIKKNLIEETYEVIEAINKQDSELLCEELGDLLMQVVFHTLMQEEQQHFVMQDVTTGICQKLIERHPHVFGETEIAGVADVLTNWDAIKRQKKGQALGSAPMQSVPRELPALMRAGKIQQKAAAVGFDWETVDGALEKLSEEQQELRSAIRQGDSDAVAEELGDLLFSAVNVSRFVHCDAEEALTAASDKFIARFAKLEQLAKERGLDLTQASLQEMDKLWDEIKQK